MRVIVLTGHARSGKDTVATMMKRNLSSMGYNVLIIHYADILKFICKKYLGWDGKKNKRGRTLLQHVGTDIIRNYDSAFFTDFVTKILNMFEGLWDYAIIPDARFYNEIYAPKECKFLTWVVRINRDSDDGLTEEQKNHVSETELDGITANYTINNCGDMNELRQKTNQVIDSISSSEILY